MKLKEKITEILNLFKDKFNIIQSKIENYLQKDKLEHFFIGTLMAFGLGTLFVLGVLPKLLIILIPVVIAITKECIDKFIRNGNFDVLDIIYTIISSIIIFFLL